MIKKDERFWEPTFLLDVDSKSKIRFLPDENWDFIKYIRKHYIKLDNGEFVIENCLKRENINDAKCPFCELSLKYFNLGYKDKDYEKYRKFKAHSYYISNVLILEDHSNKETEGKNFLYYFTNRILHDLIFEDQKLLTHNFNLNIYYENRKLWEGKTMKIKSYHESKYDSRPYRYNKTKFKKGIYNLQDLYKEDQFKLKSYDELSKICKSIDNSTINKYWIQDKETKQRISWWDSKEEAQKVLESYESMDKMRGMDRKDCYEIEYDLY